MKGFTNKRLAREKLLAGIFERFEKVDSPVKDFCEKEGIPVSVFYYWKDRFHQDGLKGLVDKRQGKPYKATDEVKRYICDIKMKDSSKSASELCALVERRFHKSLSDRHIQRILEERGLNAPVGRKAGKRKISKNKIKTPVIKNIVAGVGFLFGAMNAIKGEEAVLEVVKRMNSSHPDGKRIHFHKTSTLIRYVRTTFFLPALGMARVIELDSYDGKTLGAITSPDGRHVRYRATDSFQRELTALKVGDELSLALAGQYYRIFYGTERMPVYIDGHFKAVWTLKNIPKGKHGMMDRVMPGLKQIFLNGNKGHPLLHKTCPGDRHLTKELLSIVE